MNKSNDYFFRVISNQVRFGCGYRTVDDKRQCFAWHGYPDRNSDYITTSEISESEFTRLTKSILRRFLPTEQRQMLFAKIM